MSTVNGHYEITRQAILRLQQELGADKLVQSIKVDKKPRESCHAPSPGAWRQYTCFNSASTAHDTAMVDPDRQHLDLSLAVVFRDVHATKPVNESLTSWWENESHWGGPAAQRHHFLRAEKQTHREAYNGACSWIYTNALRAADEIGTRLTSKDPALHNWKNPRFSAVTKEKPVLTDQALLCLGNACHALQDSFATSHVHRGEKDLKITYIYAYAGLEKHDHGDLDWEWLKHGDGLWQDGSGSMLTSSGELAVSATKDLLLLTLRSAKECPKSADHFRAGWQQFLTFWLQTSHLGTTKPDRLRKLEEAEEKRNRDRAERRWSNR